MSNNTIATAWVSLSALLAPVDQQCRLFARRIARSNAEGDDIYHEALLRAAANLSKLREPTRFKPWLQSIVVSVQRDRSWRSESHCDRSAKRKIADVLFMRAHQPARSETPRFSKGQAVDSRVHGRRHRRIGKRSRLVDACCQDMVGSQNVNIRVLPHRT
jgi:hypothetical protein